MNMNNPPAYATLGNDLAIRLPQNLVLGKLRYAYEHPLIRNDADLNVNIQYDFFTPKDVDISIIQYFECIKSSDYGILSVHYLAQPNRSGDIRINEMPKGTVVKVGKDCKILLNEEQLSEIFAKPYEVIRLKRDSQKFFGMMVKHPAENKAKIDGLDFILYNGQLSEVDGICEGNEDFPMGREYQAELKILVPEYDGILSGTELDIKEKHFTGEQVIEEIIQKLVPSIHENLWKQIE